MKAGFTNKRQKLKHGSIQQYRARVVKLRRTLQEPRPRGKAPQQNRGQDQHPNILTKQHYRVASNHHGKRFSARTDQHMQESHPRERGQKERAASAQEHRSSVQHGPSSQRRLCSKTCQASVWQYHNTYNIKTSAGNHPPENKSNPPKKMH